MTIQEIIKFFDINEEVVIKGKESNRGIKTTAGMLKNSLVSVGEMSAKKGYLRITVDEQQFVGIARSLGHNI